MEGRKGELTFQVLRRAGDGVFDAVLVMPGVAVPAVETGLGRKRFPAFSLTKPVTQRELSIYVMLFAKQNGARSWMHLRLLKPAAFFVSTTSCAGLKSKRVSHVESPALDIRKCLHGRRLPRVTRQSGYRARGGWNRPVASRCFRLPTKIEAGGLARHRPRGSAG